MNTQITLNQNLVVQAIRALPRIETLFAIASPHPTEAAPNPSYAADKKHLDALIALVRELRTQSEYDRASGRACGKPILTMTTAQEEYRIFSSATGAMLVPSIVLEKQEVELLSADSPEGHFRAELVHELAELGEISVYALVWCDRNNG